MSTETHDQAGSSFADLRSFESLAIPGSRQSGNVVKCDRVREQGVRAIEVHGGEADQPSIVTHKEGDRVTRIEFVCVCGRRTTVNLEYDGE